MKRIFAIATALLLISITAFAANDDDNLKSLSEGYSFKDSTSGVSSLTVPSGRPYGALLQVDGGAIRWYMKSSTPASGTGYLLQNGGSIELTSSYQISGFRWTLNNGETGVTLYYTIFGK